MGRPRKNDDDRSSTSSRKKMKKADDDEGTTQPTPSTVPPVEPNTLSVRNKMVRQLLYAKLKRTKSKAKLKERKARQKSDQPREEPKTIEKKRKVDETWIDAEDEEVMDDIAHDELRDYFAPVRSGQEPRLLLTSQEGFPSSFTHKFLKELARILPNTVYFYRRHHPIKRIIKKMGQQGYTDLLVVNEDHGHPCTLYMSHLPQGPTLKFRLSSARLSKSLRGNKRKPCQPLKKRPEVILNHFNTRIGIRVGRVLAALFPHDPQYEDRHVLTFHNQRDFIFFRHHVYKFKNEKKVGLQELGPRFTLKLKSIQQGTFDDLFGEYEWIHKPKEMDTERTKFVL